MEFSGRLASFPIAELLHWAHNDRRTGSLVIRRSSRDKRLYFRDGQVVACLTDSPAEFYGQHLLLAGHIDQLTLFRCLTLCRKRERRLGQVLFDEGILDLEAIQRTLREQITDLVCDVFLWRHGIFYFEAEMPPEEQILAEPIDTLGLALEGTCWVDEMARIRRSLPHDGLALKRVANGGQDLGVRQRMLLQGSDGRRTLKKLYQSVRGSHYRFLGAAHDLLVAGLVRVADNNAQRTPTASLELPLHELLLEQATAEHVVFSKHHFAIPLDVLDRFVPVWVSEPDPAEWQELPASARWFLSRFDGRHRLTEIFSEDRAQRSRQAELLLLQMRNEAVALMPGRIDDLDRGESERSGWWQRLRGLGAADPEEDE